MKSRVSLLAALSLAVVAPAAFAETKAPEAPKEAPKEAPADAVKEADYAKALLGSWRQEIKEGPVTGHGITTYKADGTTTSVMKMEVQGQKMEVTAKAKWTLDKNKLAVEITECTMPEMVPVGTKITETILSITDKELRYKDDSSGKEVTETRVKPDEKKPAEEEKPGKK